MPVTYHVTVIEALQQNRYLFLCIFSDLSANYDKSDA